jgi:hypothetical protein
VFLRPDPAFPGFGRGWMAGPEPEIAAVGLEEVDAAGLGAAGYLI